MAAVPPRVRRDAAANADRILCAARTVIEADGIDGLTMDRLAARAGVGKGTVFRAFGSRTGVFIALTDEAERAFQRGFLNGPPPLGPGAPPLQRLLAWGEARARLFAIHGPLMRAVSADAADKFRVPARGLSVAHIRMLLQQCGVREGIDVAVEALLAPLDADMTQHLITSRGMTLDQIIDGWQQIARSIAGADASTADE